MMLGAFYSKLNVDNISGGRNDLKWRWRERGKRANSLGNSEQVGPYRHQLWEDRAFQMHSRKINKHIKSRHIHTQ